MGTLIPDKDKRRISFPIHPIEMGSGGSQALHEGWESDYYKLPPGAEELEDLIEHRAMNFNIGNVFKACWRMGLKPGVSEAYDVKKMAHFALRELRRLNALPLPTHTSLYGGQSREFYEAMVDFAQKQLAKISKQEVKAPTEQQGPVSPMPAWQEDHGFIPTTEKGANT